MPRRSLSHFRSPDFLTSEGEPAVSPFHFSRRPGAPARAGRSRRPSTTRPTLEVLEDRALPSVVNVLVNSTGADTTSQDTQSETAVVFGSGSNIIVAFND